MFGLTHPVGKNDKTSTANTELEKMKLVLDAIDNIVILADTTHDNNVVYMNKKAKDTFASLRDCLNANLRGADVANSMGNPIHQFHRNPDQVRRRLASLADRTYPMHSADIPIGDVHFRTKTYPIWDPHDPAKLLCFMACWSNVTAEKMLEENERNSLASRDKLEHQVDDLTTSIQQMTAAIQDVAQAASEAAAASSSVSMSARDGSGKVTNMAAALSEITGSVGQVADVIGRLLEQSQRIGQVIDTISSIADQTNLLALNAAIEAARAGEHGRGFAVVAEEVRNLALRSRTATEEIEAMLGGVGHDTREAVDAMKRTQQSVSGAEETSRIATAALEHIVNDMGRVDSMIAQIATASEEQSSIATEITSRLEEIRAAR